jgi:hypothetical protein
MVSPRAVAELHAACVSQHSPPSLPEASDYKYADELKRLQQENMQLRRDLADANNRIRELETTQQSTSLFVPSSSYTDTEDDFSVEVSVTSSVTTAPTSNVAEKVEKKPLKEQRDDKEQSFSDIIKQRGANYHRLTRNSRRRRNPFSHAVPRKIPELRRLFSSESESESSMSNVIAGSVSSMSTHASDAMLNGGMHQQSQLSSFPMKAYFLREDSDEDSDEDMRFEV